MSAARYSGVALALGCLLAGCGGKTATSDDLSAARRHLDYLLSEARADTAAMRTEMANTRIAAAKQEAELKELRQQLAEMRHLADSRQAELTALRSERDRLVQARTELQTQMQSQLAELSRVRAAANDADAARAKVADLESQLAARTMELAQAKKDLEQKAKSAKKATGPSDKSRKAEPISASAASASTPEKAPTEAAAPEPSRTAQPDRSGTSVDPDLRVADSRDGRTNNTQFRVQPGDTLWRIAQRHGVTVDQLKRANGLSRDQIETGRILIIPPSKAVQ